MEVRLIENKELLESVELFKIENLLWGTEKIAKTYGYIGFVQGEGLYIKLVCVEKDPLRVYKEDQDPVYKDSAMEAFFQFKGNDTADLVADPNISQLGEISQIMLDAAQKMFSEQAADVQEEMDSAQKQVEEVMSRDAE